MTGITPQSPLSFEEEGAPFFGQWLAMQRDDESRNDEAYAFAMWAAGEDHSQPPPGVYAGKELWEEWVKRQSPVIRRMFQTAWAEYADMVESWCSKENKEFPQWMG